MGSVPRSVTDDDGDRTGDGRRDEAGDRGDDAAGRHDRADDAAGRHDRVTTHPTPGPGNSLSGWPSARHPLRVAVNYAVVWIVRISPSLALKRWLLRRLGATIGEGVAWGLEATPDVFWPDRITVEDEAILGYDSTLLCHEFLQDEYRVGEVEIGERAMIGAGAVVLPGVRVGERASVAANSLVTEDVPPGETVAGVPARPMSPEDRDEEGHSFPTPTDDDPGVELEDSGPR
jgi:acetyltransferase-like isoleucine patch superfamily enzyme